MTEQESAKASVDAAIIATVLPLAYGIIDQLLDLDGKPIPKKLMVNAKKLLPGNYKNSFEFKKQP